MSEARVPAGDAGLLLGWSVFDTFLVVDGDPRHLERHLHRLAASARAALVPFPGDGVLRADVARVAARASSGVGRIRVTLTRSGTRMVTLHPVETGRRGRPVRVCTSPHQVWATLGGSVKHGSRCDWAVAVERAGVDEILFVDAAGRLTEGTSSSVLVVRAGALITAPHDGSILPSTTCERLLDIARELAVPVRRERPSLEAGWDGLYVANVTRGLAPVVELDGAVTTGWEPTGRALAQRLVP